MLNVVASEHMQVVASSASAQVATHCPYCALQLRAPLARNTLGTLVPVTWDEALTRIVEAFQCTQAHYGYDAVGVFGGGSLTNEKAYLLGKFARVALRTSNSDYNGRFCLSSAAASQKAFGLDRGLPFPHADLPHAQVVLLLGSNIAETMPPMMQYIETQRSNGGRLIIVDPRFSATARSAAKIKRRFQGVESPHNVSNCAPIPSL